MGHPVPILPLSPVRREEMLVHFFWGVVDEEGGGQSVEWLAVVLE